MCAPLAVACVMGDVTVRGQDEAGSSGLLTGVSVSRRVDWEGLPVSSFSPWSAFLFSTPLLPIRGFTKPNQTKTYSREAVMLRPALKVD